MPFTAPVTPTSIVTAENFAWTPLVPSGSTVTSPSSTANQPGRTRPTLTVTPRREASFSTRERTRGPKEKAATSKSARLDAAPIAALLRQVVHSNRSTAGMLTPEASRTLPALQLGLAGQRTHECALRARQTDARTHLAHHFDRVAHVRGSTFADQHARDDRGGSAVPRRAVHVDDAVVLPHLSYHRSSRVEIVRSRTIERRQTHVLYTFRVEPRKLRREVDDERDAFWELARAQRSPADEETRTHLVIRRLASQPKTEQHEPRDAEIRREQ